MKTWLAIETATEACSVALFDGKRLWQELVIAQNRHSELLLPMIDGLLKEAGLALEELDAFAVGVGPGGFTAVRLGVSTIQGLAIASARPIYPISSLQALAASHRGRPVLAAFDARRGEVYAAAFTSDARGMPQLLGSERVSAPELLAWPPAAGDWLGMGSGWSVYADRWPQVSCWQGDCYPEAAQVLVLARQQAAEGTAGILPEELEPRYLRPSQAEEARQR